MVDALATRYHVLPSDLLGLTGAELYLNLAVAFPERIKKKRRMAERRQREAVLGYSPIRKLLDTLKERKESDQGNGAAH